MFFNGIFRVKKIRMEFPAATDVDGVMSATERWSGTDVAARLIRIIILLLIILF